MLIIAFLLLAVLSLLGRSPQWQPASFDLNDPEAARAKYAEIVAIEGIAAQGRAWCALGPAEVRAIARHTAMSNTVITTVHNGSGGETTTSIVIEPAPNQEELVELAVNQIADSCRYRVWGIVERLSAADVAAQAEMLCAMTPGEAETVFRFMFPARSATLVSEVAGDDGAESTRTTTDYPPEYANGAEIAAGLAAMAGGCE